MDFKNVSKKYRPIPFWSWNEKLNVDETINQVEMMDKAGMGGYFMHARGGLQTKYMGEEWFKNVEAAIKRGNEFGMRPWAYDENGWPSGFGNGVVNGMGVEYQQKYLRMEDTLEHTETHIAKNGEHYFYYDINPFYVDTLDKKVIAEFIKYAYEPYYEKFGNEIEGFFTDEPQITRFGIPWSFVFEEEYKKRYNENIDDCLEELFLPVGDYKATRIKFWKMVTDLFSDAFMKQIYDWCNERDMKLTGHLPCEENFERQLSSNGACMAHYEYFHIPGMDWLGRDIYDCLTARQVSSVAEQLEKEAVLSETYALCGHNVSLANLKGIYEWQMVRGINLLCQHLEGYSIRGIRKRDYPPAMYYQQPWWNVYDKWIDAVSRTGMILNEGKKSADVLVMHPQTTAWTMYDGKNLDDMIKLFEDYIEVIKELEKKHIIFHLGDETIIERHAEVEDGRIIIGSQSYSKVIVDYCYELLPKTEELLNEYMAQGGKIVTLDEIVANDIVDDETITYTTVSYDDFRVHYFVNTSPDEKYANIKAQGKRLDAYTGDLLEFDGYHRFEPWGSLMIVEDGAVNIVKNTKEENVISLDGEFEVSKGTLNSLTLDKCDYYFDGNLQEKNGYVLNICERANKAEKAIQIHMDYHVKVNEVPNVLYLVCEAPQMFKISVNGKDLESGVEGYFVDKSFKKLDISKYVTVGENTISFDCDFAQSPEFYENLKKSYIFESEKNKLVYDMEIEAIYLLGTFSVKTDGEWTELERDAVRYKGDFVIDAPKDKIVLKDIQKQGFPFFCGELELEGEIDVEGENSILKLDFKGVNAVKIEIDDFCDTVITDNQISLKGVKQGKQKIKLTLINNLRNLLGPHHLKEGESYAVGPEKFFKEPCVWNRNPEPGWDDDYCFVKMGLN